MVNKKFLWEVTTWDKRFSGIDKSMQPKVIKYHYYLAKELKEIEQEDGDIRILYTTEEEAYTNRENVGDNISSGEIVAIPWGGNASVKYFNGEFVTADNRIATSSNTDILLNKYLYYWMLSHLDELESYYRGAGIKHPSMYSVLTMEITIPDLKIQQDIITKLDNITSLISNLNKEIKLTKKQFEHYRDTLLDFEGRKDVEWKTIGDLFVFKNGLNKGKEYFGKGYPIVNFTDVFNNPSIKEETLKGKVDVNAKEISNYQVHRGDVFFTRTSETQSEIGMASVMLDEISNCVFSGFVLRAHPITDKLLPEYCAYCFSDKRIRSYIVRYSSFTTRALTSGARLSKIPIPIPSIEEQEHIVNILDSFTTLISKLEEERDLHQKQYEYYREKLLTFE